MPNSSRFWIVLAYAGTIASIGVAIQDGWPWYAVVGVLFLSFVVIGLLHEDGKDDDKPPRINVRPPKDHDFQRN